MSDMVTMQKKVLAYEILFENMRIDCQCPVCKENFDAKKQPWEQKCGHALCHKCYKEIYRRRIHNKKLMKCPVCSKETKHCPTKNKSLMRMSQTLSNFEDENDECDERQETSAASTPDTPALESIAASTADPLEPVAAHARGMPRPRQVAQSRGRVSALTRPPRT